MAKTKWKLYIQELGYTNTPESLLEDTSVSLTSNKVYGFMGQSGIGKTSLWESLIQYPKNQLEAEYHIYKDDQEDQLTHQISLLPQQPAYTINPTIRASKSIKDVLKAHGKYNESIIFEILKKASFPEHLLNKYPHELSGGEIQRLAYAMSLAMDAKWLILDEPSASLDRLTASKVLKSAIEWVKVGDRVCIISSHDGGLLTKYCDHIFLVEEKTIKGPFDIPDIQENMNLDYPDFSSGRNSLDGGNESLIEVKGGEFAYHQRKHEFKLTDINLKLAAHSVVGLCGRSGSGKSTIGRLLASYHDWESGKVTYSNRISTKADIQYIPQDPVQNFHPYQSLQQQLLPIYKKWYPGKERKDFLNYLNQLSIDTKLLQHSILELSGGQRQRMLLARAMIPKPKLIILDESLSALDISSVIEILKWLNKIRKEQGFTILLISHDLRMLLSFCDFIYIMSDGRLVDNIVSGKSQNKFNSTVTKELFHSYNI